MKVDVLVEIYQGVLEGVRVLSHEEAKELLAIGFDYVAEKNGIMLFRKPKTFRV